MASCAAPVDDPPSSASATLVLQGYIGGEWTDLHTQEFTPPATPTVLGQSYTVNYSGSATFPAALSCQFRVILRHNGITWTPSNSGNKLTTQISLTDWRITSTDTGDACTGSGGTGGEEPPPDPSESGCDWSDDSASTCTYADESPITCTYLDEL